MEVQGDCDKRYAKAGFRSPAGTARSQAAFDPEPWRSDMRVFLTGGSGFVGRYVLDALVERGHSVRCLVRKEPSEPRESVDFVRGDVTRPETLEGCLEGCEAVVHLVGIIEEDKGRGITFEALHTEATRNVVQEAERCAVDRFLLMSANGARQDGVSRYQTTKWHAEQLLRSSAFRSLDHPAALACLRRPRAALPGLLHETCARSCWALSGPACIWQGRLPDAAGFGAGSGGGLCSGAHA